MPRRMRWGKAQREKRFMVAVLMFDEQETRAFWSNATWIWRSSPEEATLFTREEAERKAWWLKERWDPSIGDIGVAHTNPNTLEVERIDVLPS